MSANPFRISDDPRLNPFDTIILGGEYMPGLCKVGKPSRKYKWDKKVGPGTVGDSLTYRGALLVEWVIDLTFWEAEQVDEWDAKSATLRNSVDSQRALDCSHPTTDRLSVRSIVVAEIVELFPRGEGGCAWGVQIGVNEFRPKPKTDVSGTPSGSANGAGKNGGKGQTPTAKSAQELEIQRLLAEAKKPL